MKLSGFLLWIGASILVSAVAKAIFRLSWFQRKTKKVADVKIYTVIGLSVIFSVSYIYVNQALGIFGLWGAKLFPMEDAIFSGFIVSLGANGVYQTLSTLRKYKELIDAKKEVIKKTGEQL